MSNSGEIMTGAWSRFN